MKYFLYCRKSTESEDRQILSIESQLSELRAKFSDQSGIEIIDTYTESFSAKAPGRTLFNEMLGRIERGEAEGIIAWHPDRLARNSIDGGKVIYLLDRKLLKDLKFATFTFENNPQGKFMLSIIFGYSKYYVDSLSENIKRGNRAKIERGWRPSMAPIGYKNDKETKTVIPDPIHFPIIKRLFHLVLAGTYSTREMCEIAHSEWHYLTPKHKRMGGKPLSMSTLHRVLANPFYAGHFYWSGILHQGKHEPMISLDDFNRVQTTIGRKGVQRPIKHRFAFTGLMRCGQCGLRITAEKHTNRYGSQYTYYHCTKRALGPRCDQAYVEVSELNRQIVQFLASIGLPRDYEDWIIHEGLKAERQSQVSTPEACAHVKRSMTEIERQMKTLTDLRLQGYIEQVEFATRHQDLQIELKASQDRLANLSTDKNWFESFESLVSFSKCAVPWLLHGDDETKRIIFKTAGSNPTLLNKKLSIHKAKPFISLSVAVEKTGWWRSLRDVRTLIEQKDKEMIKILDNIKEVKERLRISVLPVFPEGGPGKRHKDKYPSSRAPAGDEETADTC